MNGRPQFTANIALYSCDFINVINSSIRTIVLLLLILVLCCVCHPTIFVMSFKADLSPTKPMFPPPLAHRRRCSSPRARLSRLSGRPQKASTAPLGSNTDHTDAATAALPSSGRRMVVDDGATRYALSSRFPLLNSWLLLTFFPLK